MMVDGSLARQWQYEDQEYQYEDNSFVAHEGGGLDRAARAGADSSFFLKVAFAAVLVVALCLMGAARVALTASTVSILRGNEDVSAQIKELRTLNRDLQIECSLFSGSERIGRIATQNLGMVHANEVECLELR